MDVYMEEEDVMKNFVMKQHQYNNSNSSSPSSSNSSHHHGFIFNQASSNNNYDQDYSLINFKSGENHMNGGSNFLNFGSSSVNWEVDHDHHQNYPHEFQADSVSKKFHGDNSSWLYTDSTIVAVSTHHSIDDQSSLQDNGNVYKRPHMRESMQSAKKQCTSSNSTISTVISETTNKKVKSKSLSPPSKDPQSIAAKNRRERISERLKVLQELVPNGSKVDLVTMLEKAISYVKFLQLQVKVLATDEFWPVQGGKAPDISQVKEAIDAILSDKTNCTSKQ